MDERTINLPWNAMSFVVQGKRYSVLRINHPENPRIQEEVNATMEDSEITSNMSSAQVIL